MPLSEAALTAAHEDEAKMAHQDLVIEETNAAKNDVEAYIYSQRDVLIGDLRTFCQDSEKEKQEAALRRVNESSAETKKKLMQAEVKIR